MTLASIKAGDVVEVDKKGGRRFHALVRRNVDRLEIHPFDERVSYRSATAREVIGHWRASKATRTAKGWPV